MVKFVAIEALDGSGKSLLANTLVETSSDIIRLSKWKINGFWETVKKAETANLPPVKYLTTFHALSLMAMQTINNKIIEEKQKDNLQGKESSKVIIVTGWTAGLVALHKMYLQHYNLPDSSVDYNYLPLLTPDATIYLKPPYSVRYDRIFSRDKEPNERDKMTLCQESEDIMQKSVQQFYEHNVHVIDNSCPFEQTLYTVKEVIENL